MKVISYQLSAFSKKVGTQDRTREQKEMFTKSKTENGIVGSRMRKVVGTLFLLSTVYGPLPTALAQNECGLQLDPGNPEFLLCDDGSYADGVTYDTDGDLGLVFPVATSVGTGGIDIDGTGGADAASVVSVGNLTSSFGIQRAVNLVTGTGDINLDAGNITASSSSGTHGVRAITDEGAITLNTGNVSATSLANSVAAIEAQIDNAGGPSRDIEINSGDVRGGGGHGILAAIEGDGDIDISAARVQVNNTADAGVAAVAAIEASTTGDIQMNLDRVIGSNVTSLDTPPESSYDVAAGIIVHAGGTAEININNALVSYLKLRSDSGTGWADIDGNRPAIDGLALLGSGNRVVLNMRGGGLSGRVDLSAVTGSSEITIGLADFGVARWEVMRDNPLSSGADEVNVAEAGILHTFYFRGTQRVSTWPGFKSASVIDFGDGDDVLNNDGRIWLGPVNSGFGGFETLAQTPRAGADGRLHLLGLETFDNNGEIFFGLYSSSSPFDETTALTRDPDILGTDRWADDMLSMPGANYIARPGSRIFMDVDFRFRQSACAPDQYIVDGLDGDLPAADCIDLRGGSAERRGAKLFGGSEGPALGHTSVVISDVGPGYRGGFNPEGIVLVDVAGGTADPRTFQLDPASDGYTDIMKGGAIDKGLFLFALAYDDNTQQFKLASIPGAPAWQQPVMATFAQEMWRTSTGGWLDRERDLRDDRRESGRVNGVWVRGARDNADRSDRNVATSFGQDFGLDNNHAIDTWSTTLGVDVLGGNTSRYSWVAGAMLGYAHGRVDFKEHTGSVAMDGTTLGVYGSMVTDSFFVDAVVNANWLQLDQDVPSLDLFPDTAILNNKGDSIGAQIEAGWRWKPARFGVEPLATFSWVRADFDDLKVPDADPAGPGNVVVWEDTESRRAGLGVRLSYDNDPAHDVRFRLSLTGRAFREFEDENSVAIKSVGQDAIVQDELAENLTEIVGGLNIFSKDGGLSGFFNVNLLEGSDYSSRGLNAGLRYQW